MNPLLTLTDIRNLAEQLDVSPTKKLGQNFVHDHGTLRRIVDVAHLPDGASVLEIGPGLGSLTLALLQAGHRVTACEIDPTLAQQLPITVGQRLPEAADRLTVIEKDALTLTDYDMYRHGVTDLPRHMVANLPYNIAVPVIIHILSQFPSIESMVVMVQKEVGERLTAPAGTKTYGVPTAKCAWWGTPRLAGTVGAGVFWPRPRVDSVLVVCDITQRRGPRQATFSLIDQAFHMRRKTVRANLKNYVGSADQATHICRAAGVDPAARAETLTIDDFLAVTRQWQNLTRHQATAHAPGKINLVLHVDAPDSNGYHPLSSVFHSVDVWEHVTVTPRQGTPGCRQLDITMVDQHQHPIATAPELADLPPADNLAVVAVDALLDYTGTVAAYDMAVTKQVPVAAGMAGGSADAAAALVAANDAFSLGVGTDELEKIGRTLGADVPQALYGYQTPGIRYGDVMGQPFRAPTRVWVFIVAQSGLSTARVFQHFDAHPTVPHHGEPIDVDALNDDNIDIFATAMTNDLQQTALTLRPELATVMDAAHRAGATKALLSGAGPTIGCVCRDHATAHRVVTAVANLPGVARTIITTGPVAGAFYQEADSQ